MKSPLPSRIGFPGLVFAALAAAFLPVLAAQASVAGTTPANGSHDVPAADNVSATLSVAAGTPTSGNYIIRGSMSGVRSGVYSGSGTTTPAFNPDKDFLPGEEVEVTLTDALPLQAGGTLGAAHTYRFTTAAHRALATFDLLSTDVALANDSTRIVVVGDLNNDGLPDIVVGNSSGQNVVYLNGGSRDFPTSNSFGTGTDNTWALALGDINSDGFLDIVVGNLNGQNTVYLNDGAGLFVTSIPFGTGNDATYDVSLGDFNGSGDLDIAVGNFGQQNVVYLNDGNGSFAVSSPFGPALSPTLALTSGDLDNNGTLDLVVGNYNEQNTVYLNDGSANFPASSLFGPGTGDPTQALVLGDLDDDGDLDLVVGNIVLTQNAVYFNDGNGSFTTDHPFGTTGSTITVALGDLDGDGDLDLVVGNSGQQNLIYFNEGSGHFSTTTSRAFGTGSDKTYALALGDLDGDGDIDIVAGNHTQRNVAYFNGRDTIAVYSDSLLPAAKEGALWQHALVAIDRGYGTPPLAWSLSGEPSWLSIDAVSGVLNAVPPAGALGNYSFDVNVNAAGGASSDTKTFEWCVDGTRSFPYQNDFEQGMNGFFSGGSNSRIRRTATAANTGTFGAQLDARPGDINWTVTENEADNPALWPFDATYDSALQWTFNGTGVTEVNVGFDWKAVTASLKWYANLIFEASGDGGATWTVYSGNGANAAGIYRPSAAATTTPYNTTTFTISGLTSTSTLLFRMRWLVKWALEDTLSTAIFIDNVSITAVSGGSGGGPTPPTISGGATFPSATREQPYAHTLTASGGTPPFVWTLTNAPAWLSVNAATGAISGIPPADATTVANLVVTVTDAHSPAQSHSRAVTLPVLPAVSSGGGGNGGGTSAIKLGGGAGCALASSGGLSGWWMLLALVGFGSAARLRGSFAKQKWSSGKRL